MQWLNHSNAHAQCGAINGVGVSLIISFATANPPEGP